MSPLYLN